MTVYATETPVFAPGDRVNFAYGTDVYPGTVVKATAKRVTVRKDQFHPHPDWKPDWQPGGFAGHVSNNYSQRNVCTEDPGGSLVTFSLINAPKRIRDYYPGQTLEARWVAVGGSWQSGPFLKPGWSAFRDYNY